MSGNSPRVAPVQSQVEVEVDVAVENGELRFTNPTFDAPDGNAVEIELQPERTEPAEVTTSPVAASSSEVVGDLVHAVLSTRPSVMRGRSFRRERPKPQRSNTLREEGEEGGTERGTLTGSLPGLFHEFSLEVEDIEEGPGDKLGLGNVKLRKSTRRLKERLDEHRQRSARRGSVAAKESLWANFRDVKWPKFKSRLRVISSYELWKGHMKQVEGHFGSAVVSYFIFIRFLFFMNLVLFALWFGFVVIPGIEFVRVNNPPHAPSQLSCVYNESSMAVCPNGENGTVFYEVPDSCSPSDGEDTFQVRLCIVEPSDNESFIATSESGDSPLTVSRAPPQSCNINIPSENLRLQLCAGGIEPYYVWYQYFFDFVLGQGVFNDTVLFYGRYGNGSIANGNYEIPLAYITVAFIVYTVSVVLLVYKMGHAYNESYVNFSSKRKVNFCNKVFTAWDFNIINPHTAKLKRIQIKTDLEEELVDFEKRLEKRSRKELLKVFLIRLATNTFTFIVLVISGASIYFAAQYGLRHEADSGSIQLEGLVLPVVITVLNFVLPFMFSFLARYERFKTHSGEVKMTLLRAIIVRLSSLIVLVITLFVLIECTQASSDDENDDTGDCSFDFDLTDIIGSNLTNSTSDCTITCWETFFGQEFYKLALINLIVSVFAPILAETGRNILSRIPCLGIGEKIGKGNFDIPKSILDLIYMQAVLWLGFVFSPLIPIVILINTVLLFYVKKYSLLINLVPDQRTTHRAARTNFVFLFLMFVALFGVFIPIGIAITILHPTPNCGPFRGHEYMYTVITEKIDTFSCSAQAFFDYVGSPGFVIPIIVFLLLVCYTQYVLIKSRDSRFKLIKKQLILEGANVTHIVGHLEGALKKLAEQRELQDMPLEKPDSLQERRRKKRIESLTPDTSQPINSSSRF